MVGMSKAKAENKAYPKRFYQQAEARDGRIYLDGKELRTQARNPLVITAPELADAIAAEWNAQVQHIHPEHMPLTRLANLTIDRAPTDRAAWEGQVLAYLETDLLCYRHPEIAAQQAQHFDPVLQWAAGQGMVLATTHGLMPIAQPPAAFAAARAMLATATDAELAAITLMVPLLGSAVLALALWQKAVALKDALAMARLDEAAQAERWGVDAESEAMWAGKMRDIGAAVQWCASR